MEIIRYTLFLPFKSRGRKLAPEGSRALFKSYFQKESEIV